MQCAVDRVERAAVGDTVCCPAEASGAHHGCDLILIKVALADPDVRHKVLKLGREGLASDDLMSS